jgi:methylmalonyl-CoA mutase N-terminal domain/subunit
MEADALTYIDEIDNMGGGAWRKGATPNDNTGGYGGAVAGINRGYFRRQIAEASYRFSEECEAKDRIIVGVNEYTDNDEDRPIDILTIPDSVETEQVARLEKFKKARDADHVSLALDNIRAACRGEPISLIHDLPLRAPSASSGSASALSTQHSALHPTNVMPALIDAALANCTLGEMTQAMADIYGRYSGGPEW